MNLQDKEYENIDILYFKDLSEAEKIIKLILSNRENDDIESAEMGLNTKDTKEFDSGAFLLKEIKRKNKSTEEKQRKDLAETINSVLETI